MGYDNDSLSSPVIGPGIAALPNEDRSISQTTSISLSITDWLLCMITLGCVRPSCSTSWSIGNWFLYIFTLGCVYPSFSDESPIKVSHVPGFQEPLVRVDMPQDGEKIKKVKKQLQQNINKGQEGQPNLINLNSKNEKLNAIPLSVNNRPAPENTEQITKKLSDIKTDDKLFRHKCEDKKKEFKRHINYLIDNIKDLKYIHNNISVGRYSKQATRNTFKSMLLQIINNTHINAHRKSKYVLVKCEINKLIENKGQLNCPPRDRSKGSKIKQALKSLLDIAEDYEKHPKIQRYFLDKENINQRERRLIERQELYKKDMLENVSRGGKIPPNHEIKELFKDLNGMFNEEGFNDFMETLQKRKEYSGDLEVLMMKQDYGA